MPMTTICIMMNLRKLNASITPAGTAHGIFASLRIACSITSSPFPKWAIYITICWPSVSNEIPILAC